MNAKKRRSRLLIPTVIMGCVALVAVAVAYSKGQGQHVVGLKAAGKMTFEILPLLLFAFIVAGMIQVLIPRELVARWVGAESGLRGIFIGSIAGGLSPGGPYVSLPLAAGLLRSGAGIGTMVAYLTGWSLWAVARLPMEVGIMGWRFTFVRMCATFVFPPIAGMIANLLFTGQQWSQTV
jgi:uncharacterized membrane protein YraQ (UPF0718 family)